MTVTFNLLGSGIWSYAPFCASAQHIYQIASSRDKIQIWNGTSWGDFGSSSFGGVNPSFAVSSDDSTVYYFDDQSSTLHVTTNGGSSWSSVSLPETHTGFSIVGMVGGVLYAYMTDGGTGLLWSYANSSWTTVIASLSSPISSVCGDAANLYALQPWSIATVYYTSTGESSSNVLPGGLPISDVVSIAYAGGRLYASQASSSALLYSFPPQTAEGEIPEINLVGNNTNRLYALGMSGDIYVAEIDAGIPATITGAATIPATGGTITLTEDMTVEAAGELTLQVAKVSDLAGSKIITVAPGGKIKVGAGNQITVLAGTLLKLHT